MGIAKACILFMRHSINGLGIKMNHFVLKTSDVYITARNEIL